MRVPTYKEWRRRLCEYAAGTQGKSLHAAMTLLVSEVQHHTGISISPFTLRYHVEGRYDDVGLEAASAVWKCLDRFEKKED